MLWQRSGKARPSRNKYKLIPNSQLLHGKRVAIEKSIRKYLRQFRNKAPRESPEYEHESSNIEQVDCVLSINNLDAAFSKEIPLEHNAVFDSPYAERENMSRLSSQSSLDDEDDDSPDGSSREHRVSSTAVTRSHKKRPREFRLLIKTKFSDLLANHRSAYRKFGRKLKVLSFSKSNKAGTNLSYQRMEWPFQILHQSGKSLMKHTVQMVLDVMKDAETRRVNVYGIGGVGKTTMLKALAEKLETRNMFDTIIWLTISRSCDIRDVQRYIAAQLEQNVEDSESDLDEVAQKLSIALQSMKFLLILDDLQMTIDDLSQMGIPVNSLGNGRIIISATRSEHASEDMAQDKKIEVGCLPRDEAWELFRKQVDPKIIASPDIQLHAHVIAAECGGLPLLIIVSGRAMREESDVSEWECAANTFLSFSSLKLQKYEDILEKLEFSYQRMVSSQVKNCFKYCALLPEDQNFKVTELVDHYIQEGLIVGSPEDALKTGVSIVEDLVDASLLECVDGGLSVRMHRVIRDMALQIILSEGMGVTLPEKKRNEKRRQISVEDMDRILLSRAGLTQLPRKEEWERTQVAFLVGNELSRLPESEIPKCSNLVMLFLQRNTLLRTIPESFFDSMPSLQVLNLSRTNIRVLPPSLFNLRSLQVLNLQHCDGISALPPGIGNLTLIEVLDLWGTQIYNLPNEVAKLTRLQILRVSFYGSIDHSEYRKLQQCLISSGVISSLSVLRELSVDVHPGDPRWDTDARVVAKELGKLGELTILHLCFPEVDSVELFTQVRKFDRLSRFNIVIGNDVKRIAIRVPKNVDLDFEKEDRRLRYVNGDAVPAEVQEVLMSATAFYLDHHCAVRSLSDFQSANIDGLKLCVISECLKLKTVIDNGRGLAESALPNLVQLSLHYLPELSTLCGDQVQLSEGSFSNLKTLSVHKCPKLAYVLVISMVSSLSSLEELVVEDCATVTEIVKMEETAIKSNVPKLKRLVLDHLPQLVSIWTGHSQKVEQAIILDCPNLKDLQSQI